MKPARLIVFVLILGAHTGAAAQARPVRLPEQVAPAARLLHASDGRIRRAWGLGVRAEGVDAEARARSFLERWSGALAIAPGASFRLERSSHAAGNTVLRFVRTAHGGDVIGSSIVLRFGRDGALDYAGIDGADARLGTARARVDRPRAIEVALAHARAIELQEASRAALAIDGVLVPVWRVDVAGRHLAERTRVLIDARSAHVLAAHPLATHAIGRVYAQDPVTDEGMTSDVDLAFLTSRDFLTGRYFRVSSCNASASGCEPAQLAVADADGNFLYDPDEPSFTDAFAEVHAYHHLNRIAEYFRETHGFTWSCGTDTVMRAIVNYAETPGAPYDNAAYSPGSGRSCGFIFFGQGARRDFAYDADVVYHEATHSVVDGVAGLGPFAVDALGVSYESGAINEGIADYFAATLAGDPALAEYFMGSVMAEETALRRLDHDLTCPRDLVGEPHFDGRLWGGLGWDLRETLGAEAADALMYLTLASLPSLPSLAGGAEVLLASAAALEAEGVLDAAIVEAAVEARGLPGCERIAPLDDGSAHTAYSGEPTLTGGFGGSIAPVHYRIDIPADATELTLELERRTLAGRYHVYGRLDAPVRFVATRRPPLLASVDWATDGSGRVFVSRTSDPPLPRCGTLYLAVVSEDLQTAGASLFTVRAALERSGREETCEEPDAGVVADAGTSPDAGGPEPVASGCGCRVGSAPRASPALLLLGLVVVGARARRR